MSQSLGVLAKPTHNKEAKSKMNAFEFCMTQKVPAETIALADKYTS